MGADIQLVQAKPVQFEAAHITRDLIYEFQRVKDVVDWCHARYVNGTRGTYIQLVPNWTLDGEYYEVTGGWIVKVTYNQFTWMAEDAFDAQFEVAHEVLQIGYPRSIGSAAEHPRVADHLVIPTEY